MRSFLTTLSGEKIRIDNQTDNGQHVLKVGTGDQMTPLLLTIDAWNGQVAMINSILLPPLSLSQKILSLYGETMFNLTEYFTALDGLTGVTV